MYQALKIIIDKLQAFLDRKLKKHDTKIPYLITSFLGFIFVIVLIKFFVELTQSLQTEMLADFDAKVSEYITSFRTPNLTQYFIFVTDVGDTWGYISVFSLCSILFYCFFKRWKYVGQLALVLLLALSSNIVLKQLINRARPSLEHLVTVKTLSYPSGHAMTAMAFYGFLIYLIATFKINQFLKFAIIVLCSFLILSIGISRVYLAVHFPSDVLGGFIAGFAWVALCILILNLLKVFKEDPNT
mgnify:CR=1 FL=1